MVCDADAQRTRLTERGADAADAEARIAAQSDIVERLTPQGGPRPRHERVSGLGATGRDRGLHGRARAPRLRSPRAASSRA